jgi:predicted HAD superfamily Cof-like phosphohydrolase
MTAYPRSNFADVGVFHEKFGLHHVGSDGTAAGPRDITPQEMKELLDFRLDFMHEELDEFQLAADDNDDARMFDALIDLVYVAMGTAHLLGYPWQPGWNCVQAANMKKERATSEDMSKRRSTLDVVKPEGWEPPNIEKLLAEYGF